MLRLMPDAASLNETLRSIRQSTRRLDFLSAYDQACHALETWPDELQLEYEAIFALANLGAIAGATQRLNRLEQDRIDKAEPDLALDLKTLRARLLKDKALRQQGAERRRTALEAAAAYAAADASGGSYYPAINAASLSALSGDLTAAKDHAERALARARSQPPDVWTMFTEAEALLILGDVDAAGDAYARGATAAGENMRAIGTARRQLQWLIPALGLTPATVRGPAPPMILYWAADPSASADAAGALIAALDGRHVQRQQALAIGPVLSAADVAIAHRLQLDGVQVELVLPCALPACRDALAPGVDPALFDATVAAASTAAYVTAEGRPDEAALALLAHQQARGTALLRGAGLAAPVWRAAAGAGGQIEMSLDDGHEEAMLRASQRSADVKPGDRVWRALLFGDVNGFSRLDEAGQLLFIEHVIGGFADALAARAPSIDYVETAGDGIYVVLGSVREAAACSLGMHGVLSPARLQSVGLPGHLKLRISAHAGPVRRMFDRVIGRHRYCGTEVIRTARIEPVTPPGETYVTEQFAAALACADGADWRCDYVGIQPMAKGFGSCRMYSLQPAAPVPAL